MKVLLTGGAGFIGSCMLWRLNKAGITDITVVDHLGSSEKWKASYHTNKANHRKPASIQSSRDNAQPAVEYVRNALHLTNGNLTP